MHDFNGHRKYLGSIRVDIQGISRLDFRKNFEQIVPYILRTRVYKNLVRSKIEYCSLFTGKFSSHLDPLFSIQKQALSIMELYVTAAKKPTNS